MLDEHRRYELVVRPRGRSSADEYFHNGAVWIEGREGNNYTIDIKNNTNQRALFIVSVDGLDVLDGQPAGPKSKGYVVSPYSAISVPGWKVNDKEAAEFIFSRSRDSYVSEIGGSPTNTGVIGAMVFREYVPPPVQWPPRTYYTTVAGTAGDLTFGGATWNQLKVGDSCLGAGRGMSSGKGTINTVLEKTRSVSAAQLADLQLGEIAQNAASGVIASSPVTQEIGTGFGDATSWNTVNTSFTRANPDTPDAILALYYNTARNLEKMGIRLRKRRDVSYQANPFPGYSTGCKPPPGWTP